MHHQEHRNRDICSLIIQCTLVCECIHTFSILYHLHHRCYDHHPDPDQFYSNSDRWTEVILSHLVCLLFSYREDDSLKEVSTFCILHLVLRWWCCISRFSPHSNLEISHQGAILVRISRFHTPDFFFSNVGFHVVANLDFSLSPPCAFPPPH